MKHLLSLSIGPVQDFISAARRTADLAAGSGLLLKIVGAAAKAGAEYGELIFPAADDKPGANKILLEVREGVDPQGAAVDIKAAAHDCLRQQWLKAKEVISSKYQMNGELADAQIGCFLEIYAAWVPYSDADYNIKRSEVERLLGARKSLRDFSPPPACAPSRNILAKSPLDPAFECALTGMPKPRGDDETETEENLRNPLHLKRTEFLDAISLLKRTMPLPVPSSRDFAERRNQPGFMSTSNENDAAPPRYAYYAILQADGDDMGVRLGKIQSAEEHREFSRTLADFAKSVGDIVKRHDGFLVYAGGDDVLAFLPVTTAVECARSIAKAFADRVGANLSAGIAIVHYKQPLSISREQASEAQRKAKIHNGKNALCLALHTRGGGPMHVTNGWDNWARFGVLASALGEGELVTGVAYEFHKLVDEFDGSETPKGLLRKEAERIWNRKQGQAGGPMPPLPSHAPDDCSSLRLFANELIVAKFLSRGG